MSSTSAVDLVTIAFAALNAGEQDRLVEELHAICLSRRAGDELEGEFMLRSLRTVAEELGTTPTATEYKDVRAALAKEGAALASLSQLLRYYGSWSRAKEALGLSETTTARMIDEVFRKRTPGRPRAFTREQLRAALASCARDHGRPPLLAEYVRWRERQHELARARGDTQFHLPSPASYRRRWGSWAAALAFFGYDTEMGACAENG